MANPCDIIEDAGYLAEEWRHARTGMLTDSATVSEQWRHARASTLADTGTLSEQWEGSRAAQMRETGTFSEAYLIGGNPGGLVIETARARERWTATRSAVLADAGTLSETWAATVVATIRETGTVADSWHPHAKPRGLLLETGALREALTGTRGATLADVLTAGESWHMRRSAVLADTGTFSDTFSGTSTPRAILVERGTFSETWTTLAHPVSVLADEALAEERWYATASEATDAWTANTDTFAMSRFEGLGVDSLAVINGALHGSGPDGIYRLDADSDAGTPIAAHVTTGLDDFGLDAVKRMRTLYAGARTAVPGALKVDVRDVSYGRVAWHSFSFEARPGDDAAPQRAKLARGMRSRYWQIRIGNVAGADFTLTSASLLADSLSRRV